MEITGFFMLFAAFLYITTAILLSVCLFFLLLFLFSLLQKDSVEVLIFSHQQKLSFLEEELLKLNSSDHNYVSSVIDNFSLKPSLKEKSAFQRLDIIDKCFSRRTVEEILCALEREAMDIADNWISTAIDSLKKASPTSLKISLRSIREGRLQGVGQCLIREYRMCCHVLRSEASKDFFEGCRAILLDKDKNPKWEPSSLELISDDLVDKYFSKVDDREWEELELPVRRSLSACAMAKL